MSLWSSWRGSSLELGIGGSLGHLRSLPTPQKNKDKNYNIFSFPAHIVNIVFYKHISFNFLSKYLFSVIIVFIVFLDGGPLEKPFFAERPPS